MNRALIDVVTTARADVSYTLPIARAIADHSNLLARVVAVGGLDLPGIHASLEVERIVAPSLGPGYEAAGRGVGELVAGFTQLWMRRRPALVLLPCDRYEVLGPSAAAAMLNVPIGHLYGGEEDVCYSIDTRVRNAFTQLAHVHFVMHEANKRRLIRMGEEDWRIIVCGASSVAGLKPNPALFLAYAREKGWGPGPFISATYLPLTTLEGQSLVELDAIIDALAEFRDYTVVWSSVNLDPGGDEVARRLHQLIRSVRNQVFVESLGKELYFSLLSCAAAMVGNSSSGLLEAPSFGLPVVNVGLRQTGRLAGKNVMFVPGEANLIRNALTRALTNTRFRHNVSIAQNPFERANSPAIVAHGISSMLRLPPARFLIKRSVKGNPKHCMGLKRSFEFPPFAQDESK